MTGNGYELQLEEGMIRCDECEDLQSLLVVQTTDLVDELWQDRAGRRAIRFGQWTHAHDVPVGEDIIYVFYDVPYLPEMDTTRATQIYNTVPHQPSSPQRYPRRHLQQQGRKVSLTGGYTVKYCGDLTAVQQAQVVHWIFDNIVEAQETVVQLLGCAAFAHALSIMLAYNKRCILEADPDYPRDGTTDAQEECLSVFEQRLLEKLAQSGSAGNYQWGLDAGRCLLTFEMIRFHNHLGAGQISVTATMSSKPSQDRKSDS
ncbi:hypothetical protein BDR05DRAFT_1002308 [Suillus weaverae]|nr:hypothetical protein BDR05DRAFT_1002308 [Suillus weaverae]